MTNRHRSAENISGRPNNPPALVAALAQRKVLVTEKPQGIRVSRTFSTTKTTSTNS